MKPGLSGRLLSLEAGLYCLKVHGHAVRDAIEIRAMLTRMIDFLKMKQITSFMTSLVEGGQAQEPIDVGISSLMDTWLLLRMVETNGERKPPIVSSQEQRMAHSNQVREFQLRPRSPARR